MLKSSQGNFDLSNVLFSIDEIIKMNNEHALTLKPVMESLNSDLVNLNLYELTFDLNYFSHNNRAVIDALFGVKVSEREDITFLEDVTQTVTLGFDKESEEVKYLSYNQNDIISLVNELLVEEEEGYTLNEDLTISIMIHSVSETAEEEILLIEQSEIFPSEANTID